MATVTILSTVKNIRETAAAWLESIVTQNYEGGFDIVIIDSASTDGTKEILDAYCARYPKMSAFLYESTQPEALNYALDRDLVSGELVALIDGDCVAPKNWLRGLVHVLKEKAVDAVGGPGLTSPDAHGLERIVGMDLDSRFLSHPGGLVKRLPNMNLLLRRDILNVVRFPESWPVAYDEVFGYELNNKGYKLWFDPSSFVWHRHRSTVRRYVLQQVATAKQMARVRRESGRGLKGDNIVSGSMLLQPVVAALLIVSLLLAPISLHAAVSSLLLFTSLLALFTLEVGRAFRITRHARVLLLYLLYTVRLYAWIYGGARSLIPSGVQARRSAL